VSAAALRAEREPRTVAPEGRLAELRARYSAASTQELLRAMILAEFANEIAVVSSFGTESVVLLHMVAEIDPSTPIIFLDTGKLFGETLRYRDRLAVELGLTGMRAVHPLTDDIARADPAGNLWRLKPDACCHIRKVLPLRRALASFAAEVSGRKRFQTRARGAMERIELNEGRIKINPLADWMIDDLNRYIEAHDLPQHPLVKDGYLSIGCFPCTERVAAAADYRSGRWAGTEKQECGIHEPRLMDGEGI
jgi:phosphoadenosine phosphosulfate reductase